MGYVLAVLQIAVLVTAVYAFVHAALQRPDAYTAAEKLTKPVWLVILGVGVLLALVLGITGVAIAAVAAVAACLFPEQAPNHRSESADATASGFPTRGGITGSPPSP